MGDLGNRSILYHNDCVFLVGNWNVSVLIFVCGSASLFNPFPPRGSPLMSKNRLAFDRVK